MARRWTSTWSHSAAVNVTLPTALLVQNVSAFGGSRSFGAAAYCFHDLRLLVDLGKIGIAEPVLNRFRRHHDGAGHAEAKLDIQLSILADRELLVLLQMPFHGFLRIQQHEFHAFEDAHLHVVDELLVLRQETPLVRVLSQ